MAGSIEVSTKKGKKRNLEKLAPRTEEQLRSRLEKAGGLTIELVAKTGDGQLLKTMPLAMRGFATGSVGFALGESLHLTLTSGEDEMEQPLSLYCTTNCIVMGSKGNEDGSGETSSKKGTKKQKKDDKTDVAE